MTSVIIFALQVASYFFAPTTKPVDPTTIEPRAADALPSTEDAKEHLGNLSSDPQIALWISESDPNILFIAVHLDKPRNLTAASGSDYLTIKQIGADSDLIYASAITQPCWKQATANVWVTYTDDAGKRMVIGPKNGKGIPQAVVWRGPEAPAAPFTSNQLEGIVRDYDVPSAALGETRKVSVYLPPGYDPEKPLPTAYKGMKPAVIFFGDGIVVESMAHFIEPMITSHKIRAVVLVGASTSDRVVRPPGLNQPTPTTQPDPFANDPRAMEYLAPEADENPDDPTAQTHRFMFERHYQFFADELPKWAEEKLGVDSDPKHRVISGFSNSASFVVTLARTRPGDFGGVIANSVAGSSPPNDKKAEAFEGLPAGAKPPTFWFSNGSWERYFKNNTGAWSRYFKDHGAETHRMTVVGGHEQAIWQLGVAAALPSLLPPYDSHRTSVNGK